MFLQRFCLTACLLLVTAVAAAEHKPSANTVREAKAEIAAIQAAMMMCDAGDDSACKELSVHYSKLNELGYCSKAGVWRWCKSAPKKTPRPVPASAP